MYAKLSFFLSSRLAIISYGKASDLQCLSMTNAIQKLLVICISHIPSFSLSYQWKKSV